MRVLHVVHDIDYWQRHRADLAAHLRAAGDEVRVLAGYDPDGPRPEAEPGVSLMPLRRLALEPARDAAFARQVRRVVRAFRPEVVHLMTLKPVLYGGLALRTLPEPRVVATFAGLGRVFAEAEPDLRQRLVSRSLRLALGGPRTVTVFENAGDRDRFVAARIIAPGRGAVIPGAGFDPGAFPEAPLPPGPAEGQPLRAVFAGRLLRAKGAGVVVEAARSLAAAGTPVRIALAGAAGGDPDAVSEAELAAIRREGIVDVLGPVPSDAMAGVFATHHVLVLPTRYPEGSPRVLSEAGSVGRAAVVSDHPGCLTFTRDGIEGIVLPDTGPRAVAAALASLAADPGRLAAMAAAARRRAMTGGFTSAEVARAYRALYLG